MNHPYEILLRWKDDGTFSGGHTIRRDSVTGALTEALPLGKDGGFPWADASAEINTALTGALETVHQELSAEHEQSVQRQLEAAQTEFAAQLAAVAEERDAARQAIIDAIAEAVAPLQEEIRVLKLPSDEQVREEIAKRRAALAAEAAKLDEVETALEAK